MNTEAKEQLLKVADVAERLNCSVSNVYAVVASGELRAFRVGKGKAGLRFSDEQITAFLHGRETGGGRNPPPVPERPPLVLKNLSL